MHFPKWPRWVWRCYAATFAAVAAFVVCSFLPMWEVWDENSLDGHGDYHTFWGMLAKFALPQQPGERWVDCSWQQPTVFTIALAHFALILGALLGREPRLKGESSATPEAR